jgi:hypothetical protein
VKTTSFKLHKHDTLLLDHPMYPVPDSVQQPMDVTTVVPTLGDAEGTLVKPVRFIFQRGKRLFATMGIDPTNPAA